MSELSKDLIRRIKERVADPLRRYHSAPEDESGLEVSVDEYWQRQREWTERTVREAAAFRGEAVPEAEVARRAEESMTSLRMQWDALAEVQRSWGEPPLTRGFLRQEAGQLSFSRQPPGAAPLTAPPSKRKWEDVARLFQRPIPDDLQQLYRVSDGGFGPGYKGLNSLQTAIASTEDYRRRGPDYCGTVAYPDVYLAIAGNVDAGGSVLLDFHYDVETGEIISSNSNWQEDGWAKDDIYQVAYTSLSEMMEDWLART